ncbi:MAG: glycosyltransferase family 4 protein [Candidatus Sericytochromatia bacterium]|nr:glycosyltransferase family 4 protein [Candidatus Sericytochromatia bacterium]
MGLDIALTVGTFDQRGGIERVSVALARVYRKLGHRVTVYASDWDSALARDYEFVKVRAPESPAWLRTAIFPHAVTKKLGRHDFVHAQGTSAFHSDLLTFHSVHEAWCQGSIQIEGKWSPRAIAKRWHPFHQLTVRTERQQVAQHKGIIHACSREVGQEVIEFYGAPRERVVSLPWGVDTHLFSPDQTRADLIRSRYGIPASSPVLLFVANEFARKGLRTVIEAVACLADPAHLLVAGRDDSAPYESHARQLGLEERVHFLGSINPEEIYPGADLFVFPSVYEGWGLVVPEALACGVPVIASQFPASKALIKNGENGFLVEDPRNPMELATCLENALRPEKREPMRAQARESVLASDWMIVGRSLVELGLKGAELNRS